MSGKSFPEFQWSDDEIQPTIGSHSKLEGWRRLQEDYKILSLTNSKLRSGTFSCFIL